MTPTNTDAAREAAWTVFADMVTTPGKLMAEVFNTTIDAFLAKSLEGADEKLAEIAARIKRAELHENESICFKTDEASELLTLVTALSAEKESLRAEYKAIYDRCDKLESQLTAQKAAHAKMLRDYANHEPLDLRRPAEIQHELRRLADGIEGGE